MSKTSNNSTCGCSSTGRAAVSKAARCGFKSCHPCEIPSGIGWLLREPTTRTEHRSDSMGTGLEDPARHGREIQHRANGQRAIEPSPPT